MAYNVQVNQEKESALQSFMTAVYGWMVLPLAVSGLSAGFVLNSRPPSAAHFRK